MCKFRQYPRQGINKHESKRLQKGNQRTRRKINKNYIAFKSAIRKVGVLCSRFINY